MLEDMVLKTMQDCVFNGFHVPFVPRAPRSARRGLRKKKVEDSQICAFELLASLAGKLLQENESSSASSNASETNDQNAIVKMEQDENRPLKTEFLEQAESDSILEHSSAIMNSDSSDKAPNFKGSIDLCKKFPVSISSDINVELLSRRDPLPIASILRRRNDNKLGIRDDDENFSRYNKLGTKPRAYRHPSRIGERRLRKLLASKYWKVSPKLKDRGFSKAAYLEGGVKPFYCKRKICYQHDRLYKRRKLSDNSLVVTCDGGFSSESVCNSPQKRTNIDKTCSENGGSSSNRGHQLSSQSKDSHVKFSIKSFRIPELYIEVPENATVGSLKRTVMETVTAILGGGLRVGMLLHGKKVRDDNRTLSQTGITSEENLGFTLEPCTVQAPGPVCIVDPAIPSSQLASRSATAPVLSSGISEALPESLPLTNSVNNADCNNELLPNSTTDKTLSDSRALVSVPPLAVVPVNSKARRSELVQRRTRRPFSVTEVEALVEAVEQLGTGRWRDVKLRSFENADHRTYVDLKDKWKTLVHTAKIAPQQRRGEPVPQELLDRVLAAHAYWLQNQQSKNQAAVLKAAMVV